VFMERYGLIAARILMSIIFLVNGLNLVSQSLALHEMVAHGVPVNVAHWMILGGQVLQVIASIGLIFGIYPRLAALALILFLIPATLMAHAFWKVDGHTALLDSSNQLLQERMHGGWTPFGRHLEKLRPDFEAGIYQPTVISQVLPLANARRAYGECRSDLSLLERVSTADLAILSRYGAAQVARMKGEECCSKRQGTWLTRSLNSSYSYRS